jgi:PAS domain S-box-containing protein
MRGAPLQAYPEHPHDGDRRAAFWSLFDQSRIPMALVDSERRYVRINDAAIELYQYPREDVLGAIAGRTTKDDPAVVDFQWEQLRRTNELYAERVVAHANGALMRVSFAAHGTTVGDRWLALFVTLSARFEPDGPELINTATAEANTGRGSRLTQRERQVVRQVALGSSTRRIAAEMSLSPETIRSHVRNAMAKTGAHTRAQLVAVALAEGMLED